MSLFLCWNHYALWVYLLVISERGVVVASLPVILWIYEETQILCVILRLPSYIRRYHLIMDHCAPQEDFSTCILGPT
ncbi:hypothetical protein LMH87_004425 [Akanthomyces muscarius]|uniref:Uncharacterized protein n=1 Tax=Akanthomyces muscarius TaxID=2231603 RepID=A0A9W8Q5L8_AKAMU|nr:hypothetical protein LMH87_004425 [Akanthomyces muscarius]KAJ4145577.1 hypothetical protein LMH87_004425 [Akanthomyces muscarius]